jgi:hypothetical protein
MAQFPFRIKNLTIDFRIRQPRDSSPCFAKCDVFRRIGAPKGILGVRFSEVGLVAQGKKRAPSHRRAVDSSCLEALQKVTEMAVVAGCPGL